MRRAILVFLFFLPVFGIHSVPGDAAQRSLVQTGPSANKTLRPQTHGFLPSSAEGDGALGQNYVLEGPEDFFQMPGEFEERGEGLKSVRKAALLSLILPGAGEIYGGAGTKGKIFIFSEAAVWAGFFSFRTYGSWLEQDYKVHAATHAQVNVEGKPDDFLDALAFYDSRDQYNQFAPLYHRGEKQPYPREDFWYWQWDSREARLYYRDLKNRSKDASRKALYMVGISIVNRIVSVVDAMKTVRSYNRKKALEISHIKFDLKAKPLGHNPQVMLYISRKW